MKFNKNNRVKFTAEEGGSLEIGYTNMGEPYREGIEVVVDDTMTQSNLFIEEHEVIQLRDLLNRLYPPKND